MTQLENTTLKNFRVNRVIQEKTIKEDSQEKRCKIILTNDKWHITIIGPKIIALPKEDIDIIITRSQSRITEY